MKTVYPNANENQAENNPHVTIGELFADVLMEGHSTEAFTGLVTRLLSYTQTGYKTENRKDGLP